MKLNFFEKIGIIWMTLSVVSMLAYAFTAFEWWVPTEPGPAGGLRASLLAMWHIGGIFSGMAVLISSGSKS